MFTLTVTQLSTGKQAVVTGSHRDVVLDHLEASSSRHGFTTGWNEPRVHGDIFKQGKRVATWEVSNDA